jgi:hypothetical protein
MSADALMSTLDEAKPVHARWSEVNRQFLDFVAANPECLDRGSYTVISQAPRLQTYSSVQPWPLFFEPPRVRELAEMAVGIDGLIKAAVGRFLQNDARTIADYFHMGPAMDGSPGIYADVVTEQMIPILVAKPNGVASALSRGDYLETQEGLKLMEFNTSSFLGGLATPDYLCERYLESAPTARFLRQVNRRARPMGIRRAMLRHVVEDTARLGAWKEGDFNLAIVIYPNKPAIIAEYDAEEYTRELHAALVEAGHAPRGRVMLCSTEDMSASWKGVTLGGEPVHAVIEQQNGGGSSMPVFRAFKARRVNMFSGPIKGILADKRVLALVSEQADSADFTAAERGLIERHVAWTRRVRPSRTTFRGRPLRLPDDLPACRDDFVLKKGWSNRGDGVVVGRARTPDEWEQAIARAVREGDWVVQERLEPVPYCFHNAQAGAVPHEVVWGLFVFGEYFGGVHLTMLPTGHGSGVVNPSQGAEFGAGLALVD